MPYPSLGFGEDYIDTPQTTKRGFIVPVTKEAIFFDRTHLILQRAAEVGEVLGLNKEKRLLDLLVGTTNNYTWKGAAYNTYSAAGTGVAPDGNWVNQLTDELVDWTDVDAAEQLFANILDPNTGEPVLIAGDHDVGDAGLSSRRPPHLQRHGYHLHRGRQCDGHHGRQPAGQLYGGREPVGLSPVDRRRADAPRRRRSIGSSATSERPSPTWRIGRSPLPSRRPTARPSSTRTSWSATRRASAGPPPSSIRVTSSRAPAPERKTKGLGIGD